MVSQRLALILAVSTSVLTASTAALAQTPPPGAPADAGEWRQRLEARRAERIKSLHDALNIRPDQEGAFAAFAQAMKPPLDAARGREGGHDRTALAGLTTPERLDRMAQDLDAHMARMRAEFQARASATKTLYAALNPDQKRTLDNLPELMGPHGGAPGAWGHGGLDPLRGPGPGGPPPPPTPQE
jgi:hypothetical protein